MAETNKYWIVERRHGDKAPVYMTAGVTIRNWSHDINEAMQFPSQEDAGFEMGQVAPHWPGVSRCVECKPEEKE